MNIRRYIDMAIRREIKRYADDAQSNYNKIQALTSKVRQILSTVDNGLDYSTGSDPASEHHHVYTAQLQAIVDRTWKVTRELRDSKTVDDLLNSKGILTKEINYCSNRLSKIIRGVEQDPVGWFKKPTTTQNVQKMIKFMNDIERILHSM